MEGAAALDFSTLTTALTGAVSTGDILTIIATVIGAGMGFVLLWFGARKLITGFLAAVKKGKLKI